MYTILTKGKVDPLSTKLESNWNEYKESRYPPNQVGWNEMEWSIYIIYTHIGSKHVEIKYKKKY